MTRSTTTKEAPYSTRLADAVADPDRDNTVTGDALVMKDAANESLKAYDPQPHAESHLGVLTEDMVLPGNQHPAALKEAVTHVVEADGAKGKTKS